MQGRKSKKRYKRTFQQREEQIPRKNVITENPEIE